MPAPSVLPLTLTMAVFKSADTYFLPNQKFRSSLLKNNHMYAFPGSRSIQCRTPIPSPIILRFPHKQSFWSSKRYMRTITSITYPFHFLFRICRSSFNRNSKTLFSFLSLTSDVISTSYETCILFTYRICSLLRYTSTMVSSPSKISTARVEGLRERIGNSLVRYVQSASS